MAAAQVIDVRDVADLGTDPVREAELLALRAACSIPTGDWSRPSTVRPAAANAHESRPSPQPMSMMCRACRAAVTNSKNVDPVV